MGLLQNESSGLSQFDYAVIAYAESEGILSEVVYRLCDVALDGDYACYKTQEELLAVLERVKRVRTVKPPRF